MPTHKQNLIPYLPRGSTSFDTVNETPPAYRPSDLGTTFILDGVQRTKVAVDSGATAAVSSGLPAAGDIAYWKDRTEGVKIVTNDIRFSDKFENGVAGIFTNAPTPGNLTFITGGRTRNISVEVDGSTFNKGDAVVSDSLANNDARGTVASKGTAPPLQKIGYATGPAVANVLVVDLDLPDYD